MGSWGPGVTGSWGVGVLGCQGPGCLVSLAHEGHKPWLQREIPALQRGRSRAGASPAWVSPGLGDRRVRNGVCALAVPLHHTGLQACTCSSRGCSLGAVVPRLPPSAPLPPGATSHSTHILSPCRHGAGALRVAVSSRVLEIAWLVSSQGAGKLPLF